MPDWWTYPLLFATGVIAGALNVIAGGGSFLTLPILIFLGLPATLANGTNRVAIVIQNLGAVWGFDRHGVLHWRWATWVALPAIAGSVLGSWAALVVSDTTFRRLLALFMVVLSLWTLWDPLKKRNTAAQDAATAPPALTPRGRWLLAAGFFVVGIYGGFVQAGVGFLILAATTAAGLDLVRGNALKVLVIMIFTVVSLGIFAWQGQVSWLVGLVLAAGSLAGGLMGVRLTVLKGHRWVQRMVTAAIVVMAIKLWFAP